MYLVLDFGPHCMGIGNDYCHTSAATVAYLTFYALASSTLLPVTFILGAEYYDSGARPFFCFIWGSRAPLALALWSMIQHQCNVKRFELSHETRTDDILVRLQGLCVSVISLSIPSLIRIPKPARQPWQAKNRVRFWKQWRRQIIQECKSVSDIRSHTIP